MSPSLSAQGLFPVDGLIAVVTGAGSGIGAMIAKALSENGASAVYILDIEKDGIEQMAKQAVSFLCLAGSSLLIPNLRSKEMYIPFCAT